MSIAVLLFQLFTSLLFFSIGIYIGLRLQIKGVEEDREKVKRILKSEKLEVGAVTSYSAEEQEKRANGEWEEEQETTKILDELTGMKR